MTTKKARKTMTNRRKENRKKRPEKILHLEMWQLRAISNGMQTWPTQCIPSQASCIVVSSSIVVINRGAKGDRFITHPPLNQVLATFDV